MKTLTEFLSESADLQHLRDTRKKLIAQKQRGMDSSGRKITPDHPIHKELKHVLHNINKMKNSPVVFTKSGWISKSDINEEKPPRTEHSWPTRRNKRTGGWHWANTFGGGHESSDSSDRHYVVSKKKLEGTKVDLADLKPGDRKPTKPVGLGKGRW